MTGIFCCFAPKHVDAPDVKIYPAAQGHPLGQATHGPDVVQTPQSTRKPFFMSVQDYQWHQELAARYQHPDPAQRPARQAVDVLTEFQHTIAHIASPAARPAQESAKKAWLQGNFSNANVLQYFDTLKDLCASDSDIVAACNIARSKLTGVERMQTPSMKELHENPFGRHFESVLAQKLVLQITPEAKVAACKQAAFLRAYLARSLQDMGWKNRHFFLNELPYYFRHRHWHIQTPLIDDFCEAPSVELLDAMLQPPQNGFEVIQQQELAVQLGNVLKLSWNAPPWLKESNRHYASIICYARSPREVPSSQQVESTAFGIARAAQAPLAHSSEGSPAYSWPDAKLPMFEILEFERSRDTFSFERCALEHGHAIVTGASGSASVLTHIHQYIATEDPTFSCDAAMLNVIAFLTSDGGHSMIEAMAVRYMIQMGGNKAQRRQNLAAYRLNYNELPALLRDEESRKILREQMSASVDETIKYFGTNGFMRPSFTGAT